MSLNGTVWAPIGPSPIDQGAITANGQVTAIAIHPNNPNIIYIGTAWGGVWLTRDGGAATNLDPDLRQGARARRRGAGRDRDRSGRPQHHLRGDQQPRRLAVLRGGDPASGRAVQVDGQRRELGPPRFPYPSGPPSNANKFFNQIINIVFVDPANHLVVYLASNFGVFISTDGGLNWTQGASPGGDVRSLVLDLTSPAAARILYAGVSGVGVFRSIDGGQTWTSILSGATPVVATELNTAGISGGPARSAGKFIVALAPPTSPHPFRRASRCCTPP